MNRDLISKAIQSAIKKNLDALASGLVEFQKENPTNSIYPTLASLYQSFTRESLETFTWRYLCTASKLYRQEPYLSTIINENDLLLETHQRDIDRLFPEPENFRQPDLRELYEKIRDGYYSDISLNDRDNPPVFHSHSTSILKLLHLKYSDNNNDFKDTCTKILSKRRGSTLKEQIKKSNAIFYFSTQRRLSGATVVDISHMINSHNSIDMIINFIKSNSTRETDGGIVANALVFKLQTATPEIHNLYSELQSRIAKIIPAECNRPSFVLVIRGERAQINYQQHGVPESVGLLGGTGPLSDAKILSSLINTCGDTRDFSCVLLSFPPPRVEDMSTGNLLSRSTHYISRFNHYASKFPARHYFLLSNSAHLNIDIMRTLILPKYASIINMVELISKRLAGNQGVLVLGTTPAAENRLYPRYLDALMITSHLPAAREQTRLQTMIDTFKSGQVNQVLSSGLTAGQEFMTFVINSVTETNSSHVLLGCTELPLALDAINPETNNTYLDDLKSKLADLGHECSFIDTEVEMVSIIQNYAQANSSLQESTSPTLAELCKAAEESAVDVSEAGKAMAEILNERTEYSSNSAMTHQHGRLDSRATYRSSLFNNNSREDNKITNATNSASQLTPHRL